MNPGDAFYSKNLGRSVVYVGKIAGQPEFVTNGYHIRTYHLDEVGELDGMIRECHYNAMAEKNDQFMSAMTEAIDFDFSEFNSNDSEYAEGWRDALTYVTQHLWESESAIDR